MGETERWRLHDGEREHVVEITEAGLARRLTWLVDGEEVATKKTSEDRAVLDGEGVGAVGVRLPRLTGPARRVTLFEDEARAHTGLGGTDLDPEPGTRAAAREEWIRAHPHQHTARRTAVAVAGVVGPLLLFWLLSRIVVAVPWPDVDLPSIPWPDLPGIPWPDLPAIPWPDVDLPSIPWPDVPDWVETAAKLVGPVLLAFLLARGEVRRRHQQDERKRAAAKTAEHAEQTAEQDSQDEESVSDPRP